MAESEPDFNLQDFITDACVKTCRSRGQDYTRKTAADIARAIELCRDPKRKDDLVGLLMRVEALIDPELPLPERAP